MDVMIRFVGHVDETRRPENFPHEVYVDLFARVKDDVELRDFINMQCLIFVKQQCMVVPKNPDELLDNTKIHFDGKYLVPWHLITHLTTITRKISGEVPEIGEDGVPKLMDGTKAVIQ
jgi:hypothetical protein